MLEELTDDDLLLFTKFLYFCQEEMMEEEATIVHKSIEREEKRRSRKKRFRPDASRRKFKDIIHADFSDKTFRRMFRMSRESFDKLCGLLCLAVGVEEFKPEDEQQAIEPNAPNTNDEAEHQDLGTTVEAGEAQQKKHSRKKVGGAIHTSGGALSGEVRVAIFIRILSGASYLDLMVIFDVTHDPIFRSFRTVCKWIQKTFQFPLVKALKEEDVNYFDSVSSSFAHTGASGGVFEGCIGAVDGIAMRIKKPTLSNELRDPGAYYCRKGFYSLN